MQPKYVEFGLASFLELDQYIHQLKERQLPQRRLSVSSPLLSRRSFDSPVNTPGSPAVAPSPLSSAGGQLDPSDELKSPIISDLLRLKRRRESAFEAMNKKQRLTEEDDVAVASSDQQQPLPAVQPSSNNSGSTGHESSNSSSQSSSKQLEDKSLEINNEREEEELLSNKPNQTISTILHHHQHPHQQQQLRSKLQPRLNSIQNNSPSNVRDTSSSLGISQNQEIESSDNLPDSEKHENTQDSAVSEKSHKTLHNSAELPAKYKNTHEEEEEGATAKACIDDATLKTNPTQSRESAKVSLIPESHDTQASASCTVQPISTCTVQSSSSCTVKPMLNVKNSPLLTKLVPNKEKSFECANTSIIHQPDIQELIETSIDSGQQNTRFGQLPLSSESQKNNAKSFKTSADAVDEIHNLSKSTSKSMSPNESSKSIQNNSTNTIGKPPNSKMSEKAAVSKVGFSRTTPKQLETIEVNLPIKVKSLEELQQKSEKSRDTVKSSSSLDSASSLQPKTKAVLNTSTNEISVELSNDSKESISSKAVPSSSKSATKQPIDEANTSAKSSSSDASQSLSSTRASITASPVAKPPERVDISQPMPKTTVPRKQPPNKGSNVLITLNPNVSDEEEQLLLENMNSQSWSSRYGTVKRDSQQVSDSSSVNNFSSNTSKKRLLIDSKKPKCPRTSSSSTTMPPTSVLETLLSATTPLTKGPLSAPLAVEVRECALKPKRLLSPLSYQETFMQTQRRKPELIQSNDVKAKVSPLPADSRTNPERVSCQFNRSSKIEKGKDQESVKDQKNSKLTDNIISRQESAPKLKISFRKDIFTANSPCKEEKNLVVKTPPSEKGVTEEGEAILDANNEKEGAEEDLFYGIAPLRPTRQVKGGRSQSSGRLGDKRYFTTRILTSFSKLARNPLMDRPLSFKSYTFDASPLLKMREESAARAAKKKANSPRKKPKSGKRPAKVVLNDLTNRSKFMEITISRKQKMSTTTTTNKNKFWKSSKINSRIRTLISKNGTIQMTVDKEDGLATGAESEPTAASAAATPSSSKSTTSVYGAANKSLKTSPSLEVSKYLKIRQHNHHHHNHSSTSQQQQQGSKAETISPPIKLKIPKSRLESGGNCSGSSGKNEESGSSSNLVLKISKRKLKKLKRQNKSKKSKKEKKKKKKIPKTMKVKYKNLYGRVIQLSKNLQPEAE